MTHIALRHPPRPRQGPFRADQLHDGDRYERSRGHPIYRPPADPERARFIVIGASVLASDPEVQWAGIDAGFSPEPGMLRAPDVAVTTPQTGLAWIAGQQLDRWLLAAASVERAERIFGD